MKIYKQSIKIIGYPAGNWALNLKHMSQKKLTSASGIPYYNNEDTQSAGPRGPLLLQDFILHEKMAHFNRERIPERVVHAKGAGAHGRFTVLTAALRAGAGSEKDPKSQRARGKESATRSLAFLASIGIDAESATAASVATTSLSFALGAIGGALVLAESLGRRRQ